MHSPAALLGLLVLFVSHALCQNDVERSLSSSIADLEILLDTEGLLVDELDKYAILLQRRLNVIRKGSAAIRAEHQKAQNNTEQYLSNALNGFALIRRLSEDWIEWPLLMARPLGKEQINVIKAHRPNLPTSTDLKEAAIAIHRLQQTYDFSPAEMAKGLFNGKQYDAQLGAIDCFAIGAQLVQQNLWYHAGFWLYNAVEFYKPSPIYDALGYTRDRAEALYATVLMKQKRPNDALQLVELTLSRNPNDLELLKKKSRLEILAATQEDRPNEYQNPPVSEYQRGCRGEFVQRPSRLHCRYNTTTNAFLKLAPLKMEEVSASPYMVLYHDIVSDAEIAELKTLAKSALERSTVYSKELLKNTVAETRTSKSATFSDERSHIIARINRRIGDMTGFDMSTAELLQVMNYGLGGHYDTHFDYFDASTISDMVRMRGDRISTVLLYLSDVEQGGATVFPNIHRAFLPRKATALVWYNLNERGDGDWRTLHAACPVIAGSKWVCNKWIRERNQEFIRPCPKE